MGKDDGESYTSNRAAAVAAFICLTLSKNTAVASYINVTNAGVLFLGLLVSGGSGRSSKPTARWAA